uniref:Ig-like domain-containing protein n=1 Tax=Felis catus TaxID=9685 RepID=A0ABI7X1F0_FELCA
MLYASRMQSSDPNLPSATHLVSLLPAGAAGRSPWASLHQRGSRTMLGPLAFLCALLFPGDVAAISVEQPAVVVARAGSWATLPCKASTSVSYIHWYRHQEGTAPKRILMLDMSSSYVTKDGVLTADKVHAKKGKDSTSSNLLLLKLAKSDEGVYYCAVWEDQNKNPDEDIFPKPTIFLPSADEVKLHNTGTYLCLLEDFYPDVITIDWKEKNGKTILKSQQGDTMKTKDTYMKYTWLTVPKKSMDKEHKCTVKHENNKGGVNREILFPSINKGLAEARRSEVDPQRHSETRRNTGVVTVSPLSSLSSSPVSRAEELVTINYAKASRKDENDPRQMQLANTSAYYTYVILVVKSMVYTVIIAICLLGGPALCDNGKSS